MAKAQKRSPREAKKPKTSKKKHAVAAYLLAEEASQKVVPAPSAARH